MIYMLDSNICIYILNNQPISYSKKFNSLEAQGNIIAISSIVLAELQYGVSNSQYREQNQIKLNALVSKLEVLDFPSNCAFFYGELRASLKRRGKVVGGNDMLIASHAISLQAILITNNTSEFCHIENLSIEDWKDS